jgi:hypothetical protein
MSDTISALPPSHERITFIGPDQFTPIVVHGSGQHQLFEVQGDPSRWPFVTAYLDIQHGLGFKGTIDIGPGADVTFEGVRATSWSYQNGILDLYQGNTVIDKLHLESNGVNASVPNFTVFGLGGVTLEWGTTGSLEQYKFVLPQHIA